MWWEKQLAFQFRHESGFQAVGEAPVAVVSDGWLKELTTVAIDQLSLLDSVKVGLVGLYGPG